MKTANTRTQRHASTPTFGPVSLPVELAEQENQARPSRDKTRARIHRRVVVGTSLRPGSVNGLRRAYAIARRLGLKLEVVHVADPSQRPPPSRLLSEQNRLRELVQQWALEEANLVLSSDDVYALYGSPTATLRAVATGLEAELLVIGGTGPKRFQRGRTFAEVLHEALPCPLLAARAPRSSRAMMAASDLERSDRPVMRAAARWARRLHRQLDLVHNFDGLLRFGRTFPLPAPALAQVVTARLETLSSFARDVSFAGRSCVTRSISPAEGVLKIAREWDVDMIVVGAKTGRGATNERILRDARRSVLVVPVHEFYSLA